MRAVLSHTHPETKDIMTFWFTPEKPLSYTAGQFIAVSLPIPNPDERGTAHWFTLSSSPTEQLISITTKLSHKGSAFKQYLRALRPGDSIEVSEPMGDFVLPQDQARPLLFVAGGIGLTPMRSMAKWLLDTGSRRDIQMIYAVSSAEQAAFLELFEAAGIPVTLVPRDPPAGWSGQSGRLTGKRILGLCPSANERLIYLSGPEPMVAALNEQLLDSGADRMQLVIDSFPGYTPV